MLDMRHFNFTINYFFAVEKERNLIKIKLTAIPLFVYVSHARIHGSMSEKKNVCVFFAFLINSSPLLVLMNFTHGEMMLNYRNNGWLSKWFWYWCGFIGKFSRIWWGSKATIWSHLKNFAENHQKNEGLFSKNYHSHSIKKFTIKFFKFLMFVTH